MFSIKILVEIIVKKILYNIEIYVVYKHLILIIQFSVYMVTIHIICYKTQRSSFLMNKLVWKF